MKLCKDCVYIVKTMALGPVCTYNQETYVNPVDGVEYYVNHYAAMPSAKARRMDGDCGMEGKFFKKRKVFLYCRGE